MIESRFIIQRLAEAGATLLSLPPDAKAMALRSSLSACAEFGGTPVRRWKPTPDGSAIDAMDEAFAWLALIPKDRFVLRRIVGARALVNPVTGKPLYPWRRLGAAIGADHKAVQRWHRQGIDLIAKTLNEREGK